MQPNIFWYSGSYQPSLHNSDILSKIYGLGMLLPIGFWSSWFATNFFTGLIALVAYQKPNGTKPMSENWCCLTTNDIVVAFLLQIHPQRRCGYQHPPNNPDWHQIPSGSHRKIAPQRGAGGCGCLIKTFTSPNWVYSHKQKRGWGLVCWHTYGLTRQGRPSVKWDGAMIIIIKLNFRLDPN